jgi:threonine dehydratase
MTTINKRQATLIPFSEIELARKRIAPFINKTPILSSTLLNNWIGHEIFFKVEGFQRTGAFKLRGASNVLSWLKNNGKLPSRVIANSSGNHAQAVALAAALHKVSATIYMPSFASTIKIQATRAYGAEVVLCDTRTEVDNKVVEESKKEGIFWIPPYNHPKIVAGQGTAAAEALEELGMVDLVCTSCGGGGLLSGTWIATNALCPNAQIIGAEPLLGNDAARSLRAGTIQKLDKSPDTIADGARTLAVGDVTFPHLQQIDNMYEVSEERIIYWTQWLAHLLKIQVEPTSAMTMEAVIQHLKNKERKRRVLVILSGGNIDQKTNQKIWEEDMLGKLPRP